MGKNLVGMSESTYPPPEHTHNQATPPATRAYARNGASYPTSSTTAPETTMSVTNAATATATTLLGTITTAANVANATLTSANIVALDLQERTQNWAANARIERQLNQGTALKQAKINYAKNQTAQLEELSTWLNQNSSRKATFEAALKEAEALLAPAQPAQ